MVPGPADPTAFVRTRLAEACGVPVERLSSSASLLDLHLDSLTLVAVLTQVEYAYDIELTPEDRLAALEACTLGELVDGLRHRLAARPDSA